MTPASIAKDTGGEGGSVLTAAAIAQLTGGQLEGDPTVTVNSVASLERAAEGQLAFCASPRYAPQLERSRASAVLVVPELAEAASAIPARIVVPKPHDALVGLLPSLYRPTERLVGVHHTATVAPSARLGAECYVGPFVHVGERAVLGDRCVLEAGVTVGDGVRVGSDCRLYPRVTLYSGSELGQRVLIHAGAVIGSDGFGYVQRGGRHEKIPHVGRCIIEDDVEIGAGTTIDRGSIDDTVIGAGTKIDNLVHIAHNVRVGRLCLIAAQVGVSGSTRIEDGVVVGGQAGFQGHHTIGKGARIGGQAGVFGDVPPGETWSGYPARPHREALRAQATLFRLSSLLKRIEQMLTPLSRDR